MSHSKHITANSVRACVTHRAKTWDHEVAKERLYRGRAEGQFRLISSGDWPANETWFDVAFDADTLYVSVMALEAGNMGLILDGFKRDCDVVEVFFDPFCDRIGYQQYMVGNEGTCVENSHWPYRDPATHRCRDAAWNVEIAEEIQGPDAVRFFFFRFDLEALRARDCIGFNVGRTQSRISEHSSWNPVSSIGFCDAGCFGRLWFRRPPLSCESASIEIDGDALKAVHLSGVRARRRDLRCTIGLVDPAGHTLSEWRRTNVRDRVRLKPRGAVELVEHGRYRIVLAAQGGGKEVAVEPDELFFDHAGAKSQTFQLQGTYDWPDNFGNGVYSPRDLAKEMRWYRECGLDRVYWLDYPPEMWIDKRRRKPKHWGATIEKSYRLHGKDFLLSAVQSAHRAGQEITTIFKPFDLTPEEPFIRENPQFCIRRNPAWTSKRRPPIRGLRLYQCDEGPFPLTSSGVNLWESRNNRSYEPVRTRLRVTESVVERRQATWSPCGLVEGEDHGRVRCLAIDGLNVTVPYLALTATASDPTKTLRNRAYLLAELVGADGEAIPYILDVREEIPPHGFDFGPRKQNEAAWSRSDVGLDRLLSIRQESLAIGLSVRQEPYLPGFLEPSFEEVRALWLHKLRRGLEAGADGISVRIAHHVGCVDWLSYMYAAPVVEEFHGRTGRGPQPTNEDHTLIRRIRGDFYTEFVRQASAMAHRARKKFAHHVENRMLVPPEYDCYCQIHWDWRTWIRGKLVDEIDLKYIGPGHPDCYREILPLARRHGVKINFISADPEPRNRPRSIRESPILVERARSAGLNGINLYELWLYRRMTDRGYPMTRGSGEAIIREMRAAVDGVETIP